MYSSNWCDVRQALLVLIIGVVFVAAGVLGLVTGDFWIGVLSMLMGLTFVIYGVGKRFGPDSRGARIANMLTGGLFALGSGLVLLISLVAPEIIGLGERTTGIVLGAIGLGFFGVGTLALIVKEYRRRRSER